MKKMLWIIAFAFSFGISHNVLADSWCGGGLRTVVQSLKLDETQKGKIQPILDQLKSSLKDSWSQMDAIDSKISQQADSANMDRDTVNGLVDQKTQLIGNMMKAKIMAKNQILAVLTDKQKAELQSMMKKAEDKIASKFKSCHAED